MTNMYAGSKKQWNPFVGCEHGCTYCIPSFQRQAKRQKQRCMKCYEFKPHFHIERLSRHLMRKTKIGEFVSVCLMGDVAFATADQLCTIIHHIGAHPEVTCLLQSKDPRCFNRFEDSYPEESFPRNLILGTTIETNRDTSNISKAPQTLYRSSDLEHVNHSRKSVTIEPIMDFDMDDMVFLVKQVEPEIVWIGYDNHKCGLPEPSIEKTRELIAELEKFTKVIQKNMDR